MSDKNKGRPSLLLTDELRKNILDVIKIGCHRKVAAEHAGVSIRSLQLWLKNGKDNPDDPVYGVFYRDFLKAERFAEILAVSIIKRASEHDWKAAAWYLERKHADRWGPKEPRKQKEKANGNAEAVKVYLVDPNEKTPFDPNAV